MRLPSDHRLVSKRGTVVQCGVCEAGGVVGHTSIFGASTPAHEALDATTTADTLTLCLDRASARSLLPEDVVAALRRRRDEPYLYPPCTHHAPTIYPPPTTSPGGTRRTYGAPLHSSARRSYTLTLTLTLTPNPDPNP